MSASHPLDAELRDLWSRRRDLDQAGWTRLYEISATVLRNYKPRELAGLPEDREVYVTKPYQRAGLTDSAFWNPCPACLSGAEKVNGGKNRAKNASIIPRKILPVLFQYLAAG